jgi:hypothetical protein
VRYDYPRFGKDNAETARFSSSDIVCGRGGRWLEGVFIDYLAVEVNLEHIQTNHESTVGDQTLHTSSAAPQPYPSHVQDAEVFKFDSLKLMRTIPLEAFQGLVEMRDDVVASSFAAGRSIADHLER